MEERSRETKPSTLSGVAESILPIFYVIFSGPRHRRMRRAIEVPKVGQIGVRNEDGRENRLQGDMNRLPHSRDTTEDDSADRLPKNRMVKSEEGVICKYGKVQ